MPNSERGNKDEAIIGSREGLVDASAYNGGVLTNEDKQWFEENTRRLTERLEHLIEENIRRITERLEQRFTEQLAEHQRDLSGKIEKVETTLLTEFHKWASPQEMRQRTHAAAIRALDAEVEALGDRVNKIEGH